MQDDTPTKRTTRARVALRPAPVHPPKSAELIARTLRRRIITGALSEGEHLPSVAELVDEFASSRPTIREALRILEAESLIVVRPGARGGALVRRPDIAAAARPAGALLQARGTTLDDVAAARRVLEPAAVRMLAARQDADAIARLRALIALEMDAAADRPLFGRLAAQFHVLLVDLAGNQTLSVLNGMLGAIVTAHLEPTALARPAEDDERLDRRAARAHAKLVTLIAEGDADRAAAFWERHLDAVAALLREASGRRTVLDLLS